MSDYTSVKFEDRVVITGNHGSLIVERSSGSVLAYLPDENSMEYSDIVKFDVSEFIDTYGELDSHIDILDIGFWTDTGGYEPPAQEHRAIVANCVAAGSTAG